VNEERDLILVTGMSGAGRSTIAHALEDLGWYVVDNLPPAMLDKLVAETKNVAPKIAVVIDVRGRHLFSQLNNVIENIKASGVKVRILFVDSSDDALVKRFESTRRPHPLQGDGVISDGIAKERAAMLEVRSLADSIIDSSLLNIHQLTIRINDLVANEDKNKMKVNIVSFGYKYGAPIDADFVVDCRFIPNPHWISELRPLTGMDDSVKKYVLGEENVPEFLDEYVALFKTITRGFFAEGRKFLTVAVGCTGGKHRSVAIAHELANRLNELEVASGKRISAAAIDRDLGKEA
jgi:RNase adapter protein RapZ